MSDSALISTVPGRGIASSRRYLLPAYRCLVGAGLLLAWQYAAVAFGPYSMAQPTEVLARIARELSSLSFVSGIAVTLYASFLGFVIGTIFAFSIAVGLHRSNRMENAIEPFIYASMGIPIFALAPLLIFWCGINLTPKIVLTSLTVFYILYISATAGLRAIDGRLVTTARILGADNKRVVREIYWNSVQPFIFVGFRVAVPRAIGATIVGEFLVGDGGLGHFIETSRQQADVVGVFSGVIIVVIIIVGLDAALDRYCRWALRWRPADPETTF